MELLNQHLLPTFVHDLLVIWEIAYQTILRGLNDSLNRDQKKLLPSYTLIIRMYSMSNCNYAQMEGK